jgi:hypothetical protein
VQPRPKVWGRREGVEDVVKEVRGDGITQQQGEVTCANVVRVLVGIGSPPQRWVRVGG